MSTEKLERGGKVRVRNINYPLTGSIDIQGRKPISYRLEPGKWVEVPHEVYSFLKNRFGSPQRHVVPSALPGPDGNYYGPPTETRVEEHMQYLIEFQD
jgi:hypothetical protein